MRKLLFVLSAFGLVAGCVVAYLSGITQPPLPPAFNPPPILIPMGSMPRALWRAISPAARTSISIRKSRAQ